MAIKLAASSTLKVNSGLTLSTSSYTNNGATAESAPVLLSVQADKVYTATEFAAAVAATNPDMNSAQVARILNAFNEALQSIMDEATDAPSIDFGWAKFVFEIGGSLATASETPSIIANPCYFSGTVASKYQNQFRLIGASVDTGLVPCDLKRIRDKSTSLLNTIFAHNTFYADGRGLTFGQTGDKQELWNETLTEKVCDLALDTAKSYSNSLSLTIPATADVAVGTYWVVIDCAIAGTVYHMTKKVTVAEAAEATPSITKVKQGTRPDNEMGFDQQPTTLTGTFPGGMKTGDQVLFECLDTDGQTVLYTSDGTQDVTSSTATSIVFNTGTRHRGTESATLWDDHTVRVVFKRGDNRYTHNVSWYSEE